MLSYSSVLTLVRSLDRARTENVRTKLPVRAKAET
jgi:hypothetical protein